MDPAYDAAQWGDFSIAVAGAAAALAGLLFVAISINVREILADDRLTKRAGSGLITLTSPLITALLVLVPAQSSTALGLELLALGVVLAVALARLNSPRDLGPQRSLGKWFWGGAVPLLLIVVPMSLAGIGELTDSIGGLYWLAFASVVAVITGISQAWVLLIEILR